MIRSAIVNCCKMATPLILEPYNQITAFFPEEYLNKIQHSILRRRGSIENQEFQNGYLSITGLIPCNEIKGLGREFMDSTGGRVNWSQGFQGFHHLPSGLVDKILPIKTK